MADFADLHQYLRRDYFASKKWDLLSATPLGRRLGIKQMDSLLLLFDAYEVPEGVTIFEEGAAESYMGLLVHGEIEIRKKVKEGNTRIIATVPTGGTFGELSLVDGEPRSASAVVVKTATLLIMTKDRYSGMLDKDPNLARSFLLYISELMAQRLRRTTDLLVELLNA